MYIHLVKSNERLFCFPFHLRFRNLRDILQHIPHFLCIVMDPLLLACIYNVQPLTPHRPECQILTCLQTVQPRPRTPIPELILIVRKHRFRAPKVRSLRHRRADQAKGQRRLRNHQGEIRILRQRGQGESPRSVSVQQGERVGVG